MGELKSSQPEPGTRMKSIIRCESPANGVDMNCQVGTNNAKASSTAVSNAHAFAFTLGIRIQVGSC